MSGTMAENCFYLLLSIRQSVMKKYGLFNWSVHTRPREQVESLSSEWLPRNGRNPKYNNLIDNHGEVESHFLIRRQGTKVREAHEQWLTSVDTWLVHMVVTWIVHAPVLFARHVIRLIKTSKNTVEALWTDTLVSGQLYLRPHTNSVLTHSRMRPCPAAATFSQCFPRVSSYGSFDCIYIQF